AFRVMMSAEFYQGAKLRGQEYELSVILKKLKAYDKGAEILTSSNLSRINNHGLNDQMQKVDDPDLRVMLADMGRFFYPRRYRDEIVALNENVDGALFSLPLS